jgi:hypothetical protein
LQQTLKSDRQGPYSAAIANSALLSIASRARRASLASSRIAPANFRALHAADTFNGPAVFYPQ